MNSRKLRKFSSQFPHVRCFLYNLFPHHLYSTMFTVLFTSATLSPHYTHVICISIFCPYPNVSYDTLTTREGAARQDSSGAAAAQEVGTVWKLAGDRPHLWSVPSNPQFRPLGLSFQGLGKRGSKSHTQEKKRERTTELPPSEIRSRQKATTTSKAVTMSKAADPF